MSNAELEANLLQNSYEQAAISGESSQKWSSDISWYMFQLYNEIIASQEEEDTIRVTSLLNFATKKGWTRTPKTPITPVTA